MDCYVQRVDGKWDKMSLTAFRQSQKAVNRDGSKVYSGIYFCVYPDGGVCFSQHKFTPQEMAMISRIAGFKTFDGTVSNGIYSEPEVLRIKTKNGVKLIEAQEYEKPNAA